MKRLLLYTSLTLLAPSLTAQTAQNRDNVGETPGATPSGSPGSSSAAGDRPQAKGGGETASDKSFDEQFIQKAAKAGMMEVKMGQAASSKASREDVKAFGATLVKDHTAANTELAGIAKSLGVDIVDNSHGDSAHAKLENDLSGRQRTGTIPKDPSRAGDDADKHSDLKDKSGPEFDMAFIAAMDRCHKEDIALFERAQGTVKAPPLKAFITKTLPVLKSHEAAIAALQKKDPGRPDARNGNSSGAGSTSPASGGSGRSPGTGGSSTSPGSPGSGGSGTSPGTGGGSTRAGSPATGGGTSPPPR